MTEPATITLRPAEPSDAESIATMFTDEGYPAGPSDIVTRLERFATPGARVIVAEHDDALLGFIAIHALPRFEHDDWIVRILALVVDAGARERGVGRALMAEAERVGREIGGAFIELTAGHHRPEARHLYESLGYDPSVTAYLRKKL
jgi:GNAT superfamily N-acetyltransferase